MFNKLHDAVSATTQHIDEQLTQQIQELEAQLKALRENQTTNKARQQRQLTLVGALQSALGQVVRAVHATQQAEEEELLDAFWQEIEAVQSGEYESIDLAQLPEPNEPNETETDEPDNPEPGDGNGVVDVDVEVVNGNGNSNSRNNGDIPDPDDLTLKQIKDAVLKVIERDQVYEYGPLNARSTWEKAYRDVVIQKRPKDLKSLIQSSVGKL